MSLAGIVLAAGEGTRMGGPKALLVVRERPLIVEHVEALLEAGCARVIVVVRPSLEAEVRRLLDDDRVAVIAAETASAAASLALALRHVDAEASVVIAPVDTWPVRRSTFDLLARATARGADAATPACGGRGGHPVVARASLLAGFDGARTLRDVLRDPRTNRVRVEVDDPSILADFDTPADLHS